jgi:DNA repair exonuclease SbcCD nuclease subunit
MKIAIINDTHAGQRNASDVFLDYTDKFYSKVFFPYCNEHGIKTVIHAGDYLDHRKYVNFKALQRTRKAFLEPLTENGMKMYIIPGNHDVYFKNTNELCGLREVLGYFINNVQIITKPSLIEFGGLPIAFLPWIAPDNYVESMRFVSIVAAPILVSHLELAGFEMMKGQPASEHGMDPAIFKRFEMVLSGHYHTKSTRDNIHYLGTQFEQTWSDCEDGKYFHVLDTDTRILTQVKNPFTLFERLVYDDSRSSPDELDVSHVRGKYVKIIVAKKSSPTQFDRFVERVQDASPVEPPRIVESFEEFTSDRVEDQQIDLEDTGKLLHTYIEATETSLDKERLKSMMRELYVEAQAIENT